MRAHLAPRSRPTFPTSQRRSVARNPCGTSIRPTCPTCPTFSRAYVCARDVRLISSPAYYSHRLGRLGRLGQRRQLNAFHCPNLAGEVGRVGRDTCSTGIQREHDDREWSSITCGPAYGSFPAVPVTGNSDRDRALVTSSFQGGCNDGNASGLAAQSPFEPLHVPACDAVLPKNFASGWRWRTSRVRRGE